MAPRTASLDRDDDIVQLVLAVLDEALRSWVKIGRRDGASQAEGVMDQHERSGDAS